MRLSNLEVTEIEPAVVRLTVEVPPEEVRNTKRHLMKQLKRLIHVRGFRPGKAPDAFILRHVGDENIRSRLLEELLSIAYREAISREKLRPLMIQRLRLKRFTEDEGLEFEADVAVRGRVELGDYRSIKVEEPEVEVTDEEIDEELHALRERFSSYEEEMGRQAQVGDRVKIKYRITPIGEGETEGEERTTLVIAGHGVWFPPFNEYVLGKRAGEEATVELTFPEDFPNERFAGKRCKVWFSIEAVEARKLPELDDEFARKARGCESLEELKEALSDEIWGRKMRDAERELRRRVEDELLKICDVTIPRSFLEALSEDAVRDIHEQLKRDGIPVQVWEQMTGKSFEELKREAMEGGERTIKLRFLLEEIAEREGMEVSDEEVLSYVTSVIKRSGREMNEVDEDELSELITMSRWQLLRDRVMDFLIGLATEKDKVEGSGGGDIELSEVADSSSGKAMNEGNQADSSDAH